MQNEKTAASVLIPEETQIEFPQAFDLRVIYSVQARQTIANDLAAVFAAHSVPCSRIADIPTKPGKYARVAASVEFGTLEQMRTVYAALGAVAGVKALI